MLQRNFMKEKMRLESTKQMRYEKTKPVLAEGKERERRLASQPVGAKLDGQPLDSLNAELNTIQFACYATHRDAVAEEAQTKVCAACSRMYVMKVGLAAPPEGA